MILSPLPKQQFFDNNGNPADQYKLFTYVAGTSTKQTTYIDSTGTPNTNPIILNYRGECDLWLDPLLTYKFVFTYPNDTDPPTRAIWTVDNIPGGYSGLIDYTKVYYDITPAETAVPLTPSNLSVFSHLSNGFVYPERFDAVGDWNGTTGTDDSVAFQQVAALCNSRGGGEVLLSRRYKVATADGATASIMNFAADGTYLIGCGNRRTSIVEIHNSNTAGKHCIHFGDTAEASLDAAHFNSIGISKIRVTGNASSGQGIRVYNAAIDVENAMTNNHGGVGFYINKGWTSYFNRFYTQANGSHGFQSVTALNGVEFLNCGALSHVGNYGFYILSGSGSTNSVVFICPDLEGNAVGLYLDSSASGLKDIQIIAANCEANTSYGIQQSAAGNLTGLKIQGGGYYGTGNGMSFGILNGGMIDVATLTDCNLDISTNNGCLVSNPILQGTAAINAGYVIANNAGTYPNRSLAVAVNDTYPLRSRVGNAWKNVRLMMQTDATVSSAGAATYTLDMTSTNSWNLSLTNAGLTGLTLSKSNDNFDDGDFITIHIENSGGGAGTVTLPSGFKKTAAVAVPAINAATTIRFQRDGNGNWWEASRATGAS